ncbi:hypothetical protein [Uliginosibacterium sp. H1]|uniref:hypothetical protein n=1 Tax=Uliginosibacterium sp. H1 TaxID=3114757 RepID=UPI002E190F24|nr:hypothetical protein [Uliginosibacterium sp. H1]
MSRVAKHRKACPGVRNDAELEYWRGVWQSARTLSVDIAGDNWCNYWHEHFDWESRGTRSRLEHRKHLRPLMHAFARVQSQLHQQSKPHQVFVSIYPNDPGSDALYVHTPNPHSDYPAEFGGMQFVTWLPPLLIGVVSLDRYRVGVTRYEGDHRFTILPRQDGAAVRHAATL